MYLSPNTFAAMAGIALSFMLCQTSAAAPVRLLCVGDSITQANPGYRSELQRLLRENGYDVVMVGPKKEKAADGSALDHGGFGGFTIGPGPSKADEWTNGKGNIFAQLEDCLASKPDIVLLLVGTNEFFNIGKLQPDLNPDRDGPKRLAALVDRIHELQPGVKVLVGSVLPVGWTDSFAKGFNAALPDLLAGKSNTWFVDTGRLVEFGPGDWTKDNLHPSASGHKKIARVWFTALEPHLSKSPTQANATAR